MLNTPDRRAKRVPDQIVRYLLLHVLLADLQREIAIPSPNVIKLYLYPKVIPIEDLLMADNPFCLSA